MGDVDLYDYRGRWLIFFSDPAAFSPVATSEIVSMARAADQFAVMNCALLGMSTDSLYANLAWISDVERAFDVTVPFPIMEDPSMALAIEYGMMDAQARDTGTIRTMHFIDPEGVVRAITWYPPSVGRSVAEMLRLLAALQRTASSELLVPADWQPGKPVLMPPPRSNDAAIRGSNDVARFYIERDDH